jgi:CHAD domain-containing protein
LSQIKKVLPAKDRKHFQEEFSWLGQVTGPNRDLDVYLLKMADFESILPGNVRSDLRPLYEFLHRRQREEHRLLVEALDSKRFSTLKEGWQRFLQESHSSDDLSAASEPVHTGASRRIWKVYRRILKKGKAINDRSPAEALHELRIECKKLRYLLEFFHSLYESKRIRKLIKSLKLLQDNLGDFNDCEVQQHTLKGFAHSMLEEGSASAETLMAMGRLVEHLELGQKTQRKLFASRFAKFADPKNEKRFRELFSPHKVKTP